MIPEPPRIGWGPKRLQAWADALRAFVIATRPLPSDSIDISESSKGARIEVVPKEVLAEVDSASFRPFQLEVTTDPNDTSENPAPKIRVYESTLAGGSSVDLGFALGDNPPYLLTPSNGIVVGGFAYDVDSRLITSRWLEIRSSLPAITDGLAYVAIGTVHLDAVTNTWQASNSRYGPITANICREWFAAAHPFYTVTFYGS